jgi:hypothetical protein
MTCLICVGGVRGVPESLQMVPGGKPPLLLPEVELVVLELEPDVDGEPLVDVELVEVAPPPEVELADEVLDVDVPVLLSLPPEPLLAPEPLAVDPFPPHAAAARSGSVRRAARAAMEGGCMVSFLTFR